MLFTGDVMINAQALQKYWKTLADKIQRIFRDHYMRKEILKFILIARN